MPNPLRVAIVTGASRGIGRAIAIRLSRDNFAVVVNYRRQNIPAEEVVASITQAGGTAIAVQADVGQLADHSKLISAAIDKWGRLDLLVNNAGITSPGRKDILEATPDAWDLVMQTNLKGPFFLAQQAANVMIGLPRYDDTESVRYIINISSISSYAVSPNRPDYCIAKRGMEMMTQLYASRLAEEHINVYEVCPGVIASDMTAPVRAKYDRLIADGLSPIKRWGKPEDVARAVAMLARGELPFSTGERVNVDGGFHIRQLG